MSVVSGAAAGPVKELALLPRSALLSLYRSTLRHAAIFPSSKRRGIIRDIKLDWRQNAKLTDREVCHREQSRAVDGLKVLQQYVTLRSSNTSTWTLQLGRQ